MEVTRRRAQRARPDIEGEDCHDGSPTGYICTLRPDHDGWHVAHMSEDGREVAAVWDDDRSTDPTP